MKTKRGQDGYRKTTLMLSLALLLYGSAAGAGDLLFLTGAEGGGGAFGNYYTFVGAVAPLPGYSFGNGLVQKYWIDFLGYEYPADNKKIGATAVGVEGALGYQKGGENGWGGLYAGLRYSNTWLSPDHPESRVRGSDLRPLLQAELERSVAQDWKVNAIGRYVFMSDSYWARGRVMYRSHAKVYTGPELVVHGDPDYRAWQGGWFVTGFAPLPDSSIGFKAGVRKVERGDTGGYFGIEFARMF